MNKKAGAAKQRIQGSQLSNKERLDDSLAEGSLKFRSLDDIRSFWLRVRDVPKRTEGRTHKQYERYYFALYLMALADHKLLSYPLRILEGDSPDFTLMWKSAVTVGLEVTRATDEHLQREMTRGEKGHSVSHAMVASWSGYAGDQLEQESCALFRKAIERKVEMLPRYEAAFRCDLLVSDDTRMGAGDRRKVLAFLNPWARELKKRELKLGKISVVASLDVLYDIGGDSRIFPYIEWSAPKLNEADNGEAFSDRVEHAGRVVAEEAIHALKIAGTPICFIDSKGRLVKQMSDGRRFEVRVDQNGAEIMVQELSRA